MEKKNLAYDFLKFVEGLSFLPKEQISVEMDQVLDTLMIVHNGYNNFYNEPPHARLLTAYVPQTGDVPDSVIRKYVKVLTMCTIGNGYGVSEAAMVYYNELINRFKEEQIIEFVLLLTDSDVQSRLQFNSCSINYKRLAEEFLPRVSNLDLKKALEYIVKTKEKNLKNLKNESDFLRIISNLK